MKDPAFLFYSSDFLTGTMFMTDEQVGKYIRLLCAQHQGNGFLTEDEMIFICKSYDKLIWSKFEKTEDGLFYNDRLREETEKRSKYCQSRGNNRKRKDKNVDDMNIISNSYDLHMENENENENRNVIVSKEERIKKFREEVERANDCLDADELERFIEYWTASNDKDRKLSFEKQKNFYYKLRIKTWYRNTLKNGNNRRTSGIDPKELEGLNGNQQIELYLRRKGVIKKS